jgi:drug/metabolite transporter (DMT)-like permease
VLAAFLSTILFSISVVCGHRSAKLIGGTEANFWRLTCAALFLGIWSYTGGIGLSGSALPVFLVSGIMGIGVGDVALFQALPRLGSRLSMLVIQCLSAPFAALIEWLWLRTPLTSVQVGCGITILIGVGIALSPSDHLKLTRKELLIGSLFALLAAFGGAVGAVLSRKAYAITHAHGEAISGPDAAFQRILGGLLIAGICLLVVKRHRFRAQSTEGVIPGEETKQKWKRVWPWVLANSVAGQTLGVSCMQRAFETTPTGPVLAIIATTPIVVMPLAYFFEGERPTRRSLIGGVIAVAGVVLLIRFR